MKKILSCVLTISLLLSVLLIFASCGQTETKKEEGDKLGDEDSWFSDLDFENQKVTFLMADTDTCGAANNMVRYSTKYVYGPDRVGADNVVNMCYKRNRDVEKTLNINAKYEKIFTTLGSENIFEKQTMLSTPAYDLLFTPIVYFTYSIINGHFYNVLSQKETNYFNFEDESWYNDYMFGYTMDNNKLYTLAGDYFISVLQAAQVIYMNTEYFDTYVSKPTDMTYDDFADIVLAREFYSDLFVEMIQCGYVPNGTSDKVTIDDGIGLIANRAGWAYAFIYSTDRFVFDIPEDGDKSKIKLYKDITAFSDVVDKVIDIYQCNGSLINACGNDASPNPPEYIDLFSRGTSLFIAGLTLGDMENSKILAMNNKVAIPYPLYFEDQEDYSTYVYCNAELGTILKNTPNFTALSAFVQLLNEESTAILDQYYEYSLKFKYAGEAGSSGQLMNLIHDSISNSFNDYTIEQVYKFSGLTNMMDEMKQIFLYGLREGNNIMISSYNGVLPAWEEGLKKYIAKFAELE